MDFDLQIHCSRIIQKKDKSQSISLYFDIYFKFFKQKLKEQHDT